MKTILFATTNKEKILNAQVVGSTAGVTVKPIAIEVDEIQGEDPLVIVKDKVRRAYKQLQEPLVVSDDSWSITALRGFPGAYMKSINHWFKPEDFLRLMHGVEDRSITLNQYLAFTDGTVTKIFSNDVHGQIVQVPRGSTTTPAIMQIVELDSDNGQTIAEVFTGGGSQDPERYRRRGDIWLGFVEWFKGLE